LRFAIILGLCVVCLLLGAASIPLGLVVFASHAAQPGRLPDGWQLHIVRGAPDVTVTTDSRGNVLRLRSRSSSFALERAVSVNLTQFPLLSWDWKVTELPQGGDFRRSKTDDQAAQILLAFPDRRILSYVWDTSAPKGMLQKTSVLPLLGVWVMVCRSGGSELNQWISETRNVADDFQRAYGFRPSQVKGIRLQINSQHTGSSAESYFGDVQFHSAAQ
jgi:hypothetical protein